MTDKMFVSLALALGLTACVGEGGQSEGDRAESLVEPRADRPFAIDDHYTETRNPIVLLPGILGFEKMLGVVEYYPAVGEALTTGGARVFIAYGSKANSSEVRARQIIPQLDEIKAITGAERLNLIGHSQGAVDARIIAKDRPDLVASVTSVGGPHRGSFVADKIASGSLGPLPGLMLGAIADLFTLVTGATEPNDVDVAMRALSSAGMAELNARYPAALPAEPCGQGAPVVDGIHYYSWGGVASLTNPIDLLDPLWLIGSLLGNGPNDGLIARCSSHLGAVVRDDYPQNHIDETNMLFGLTMPFGPSVPNLYRQQASRLQVAGL